MFTSELQAYPIRFGHRISLSNLMVILLCIFFLKVQHCTHTKSADPSRRDMEISYAGSKRCRVSPNPNSEIQTPKSKTQTPNSKIQTPNSKLQNPNSKTQNPNKRPVWSLDFGFGRGGTGGDGCVANDDVWPCWPPEFGPVGGALGCSRKVAGSVPPTQIGHRFHARNRAPISGPVSWKSGPSFRRNCGPGGAAQNVRSTSRGADHVCKCKGCQHHVASAMCAYARDVNIA